MTNAPATIMYASIVSRETVKIVMMIATLVILRLSQATTWMWTTFGLSLAKMLERLQ